MTSCVPVGDCKGTQENYCTKTCNRNAKTKAPDSTPDKNSCCKTQARISRHRWGTTRWRSNWGEIFLWHLCGLVQCNVMQMYKFWNLVAHCLQVKVLILFFGTPGASIFLWFRFAYSRSNSRHQRWIIPKIQKCFCSGITTVNSAFMVLLHTIITLYFHPYFQGLRGHYTPCEEGAGRIFPAKEKKCPRYCRWW